MTRLWLDVNCELDDAMPNISLPHCFYPREACPSANPNPQVWIGRHQGRVDDAAVLLPVTFDPSRDFALRTISSLRPIAAFACTPRITPSVP